MRPIKTATQKNIIVDKDYYTNSETVEMLKKGYAFTLDCDYNKMNVAFRFLIPSFAIKLFLKLFFIKY